MDRVVARSVNHSHEAVMLIAVRSPPEGGRSVMAYGKQRRPGKSFQNTIAKTHHTPSFIGGDAAIRLLGLSKRSSRHNPQAERHAKPKHCIRKSVFAMVQHACAVLGSVALFDEGSQSIQTTELFRTFQDVIVPERPAVHCSVHRGKLQRNQGRSATHPKNRLAAESPHLSLN